MTVVSNHDEDRAAYHFGSRTRANGAALVTFTLPGMRLYWEGLWQGYTYKLDIHLRRELSQPVNNSSVTFYLKLLEITTQPVFNVGTWTYVDIFGSDQDWRLMAWRWNFGTGDAEQKRLVVVNYSSETGNGKMIVSNATPRDGNDMIPFKDLLTGIYGTIHVYILIFMFFCEFRTGTVYMKSAKVVSTEGLFVIIDPFYAQIFEY